MKFYFFILRFIICITFLSALSNLNGQSPSELDSLEHELSIYTKRDTVLANLYNVIASRCFYLNIDKAKEYLLKGKKLSEELNYQMGILKNMDISGTVAYFQSNHEQANVYFEAVIQMGSELNFGDYISRGYNGKGSVFFNQGNYSKAIEYFQKSVDNDKRYGLIKNTIALSNIGACYSEQGNFENALKFYRKSLEKSIKLDKERAIATTLNNIGTIYDRQGNYPKAFEYYTKALKLENSNLNFRGTAIALHNIGRIFKVQNNYKKALLYLANSVNVSLKLNYKSLVSVGLYEIGNVLQKEHKNKWAIQFYLKAFLLDEEVGNEEQASNVLIALGQIYFDFKQYETAMKHFVKALNRKIKIGDQPGICESYLGISKIYFERNNIDQGLESTNKAIAIANKLNLLNEQRDASKLLADVYNIQGNQKKAFDFYAIYKSTNDSIFNKENERKIASIEYDYAYQRKLKNAREKEDELTKEVIQADIYYEQSQRKMLYGVIGFLSLVILLVTVISILRVRNVKSKSEQVLVEQKLLRSQMTPHFIFNSISVLQGIVSNKEYEKSEIYMSKFSKLLRRVLENSKDKAVKLTDELLVIENYLAIQNLGVDNLYDYKITVDENVNIEDVLVPPMIIQPFIENAIEHGFKNKGKDRKIDIRLKFEGEDLICAIEDNGVGINFYASNQSPDRQSMSTAITAKRLKMLAKQYMVNTDVKIEDRSVFNEVGTLVTLMLPYTYSIDKLIRD